MPDYAGSIIQMIDQRVAAGQKTLTKMGTVQGRDGTGATAYVSMDGSSGTAQPVKCFESVIVVPGDRVGLVKFEGDWVIVGNYTGRTLGRGHYDTTWSSAATSSSSTLVDMPNSPTVSVTKRRDATQFKMWGEFSARTSAANTAIWLYMNLSRADGTSTPQDFLIFRRVINTVSVHMDMYGTAVTFGSWPAGDYLLTARWMMSASSTPTVTVDANDSISMDVEEIY